MQTAYAVSTTFTKGPDVISTLDRTLNINLILKMVESAQDAKEFSCKKCRTKLFCETDLVTHNSKEKKFKA